MRIFFTLIGLLTFVSGQLILPTDPYNLVKHEQKNYIQNNKNIFCYYSATTDACCTCKKTTEYQRGKSLRDLLLVLEFIL